MVKFARAVLHFATNFSHIYFDPQMIDVLIRVHVQGLITSTMGVVSVCGLLWRLIAANLMARVSRLITAQLLTRVSIISDELRFVIRCGLRGLC